MKTILASNPKSKQRTKQNVRAGIGREIGNSTYITHSHGTNVTSRRTGDRMGTRLGWQGWFVCVCSPESGRFHVEENSQVFSEWK
jgi:hypothetical protein